MNERDADEFHTCGCRVSMLSESQCQLHDPMEFEPDEPAALEDVLNPDLFYEIMFDRFILTC